MLIWTFGVIMHNKQIKRISTDPKSGMDYLTSKKVPAMTSPTPSPLWQLLNSIPPRLLVEIKGVQLNPKLGYNNGQKWQNAAQLFNWLGGTNQRGSWESSPADSYIDRRFKKRLKINDLLLQSSSYPSSEVFSRNGIPISEKSK